MKNKLIFLMLFLLFFSSQIFADEKINICYGYGCLVQTEIVILKSELKPLIQRIQNAQNAEEERQKTAEVLGELYKIAGRQSPIWQDKAGNFNDPPFGKMDCIDHSTTSDRFLKMLARHRAFKWHKIAKIQRRFFLIFPSHYSAAMQNITENQIFVFDSWFVEQGEAAVVLPLESWKKGEGRDV